MTFPPFKRVVMPQRYNMPYRRQKPLGLFLKYFFRIQNIIISLIFFKYMIGLKVLDTKLNYLMCMDIAGLDKFDFHDLSRKLSNKYVISVD